MARLQKSRKSAGTLLEEDLRREIFTKRLSDGQAITPELELARRYRISRNTVRKTIDKLVASGLLYRQQGSGTFVAQGASGSGTARPVYQEYNARQVVFLSLETVLSETSFRSEATFDPIFRGLNKVLQPLGYNLLLAHVGLDWTPPPCLVQKDVSGVIFHGRIDVGFWQQYIRPFPNIGLQYVNPDLNCSWVKIDNFSRSYQALKYLHELGHERIGFVSNESEMPIPQERYAGYLQGLKMLGLPFDPAWAINWQRPMHQGVLPIEEIMPDYRPYLEKAFAGKQFPSALICLDNWRASCTIEALLAMGFKVPEDVSLIGGQNVPDWPGGFAVRRPELEFTRFCDRLEDICAVAAKQLVELFAGQPDCIGNTIMLRPELIIGKSTCPCQVR